MVDTVSAQAPAPTPASEAAATPAPTGGDTGGSFGAGDPIEPTEFEKNFSTFMNHDWDKGADAGDADLPQVNPDPAAPKAAPETPPVEAKANGASPAPAAPAAAASGAEPKAEVPPEALAAMMLGTETPLAAPTPAPVAPVAPTAPAASAEPEEAWQPFPQVLNVPDQLTAALFESEDTQTRKQALGVLLGAVANSVAAQVEARFKAEWSPKLQADISRSAEQQTTQARMHQEFYEDNPDLNSPALRPLIARAFQVTSQMRPDAPWDQATRKQIGALARETASRMGFQVGATPAASAAPAGTKAPAKTPYVAGGARPAGYGQAEDKNSPAGMVEQLSFADFGG